MLILILLPLLVSSPLHDSEGHHSQSHSHTSQSSSTELDGKKNLQNLTQQVRESTFTK